MRSSRTPLACLVASLLVLGGLAAPAAGQPGGVMAGPAEVDLKVLRFGVDGKPRAGSWFGVQVQVTDRGDAARDALVQLTLKDPDGDRLLLRSHLVLNPGRDQPVWLYSWLPYDDSGGTYLISVYEASETGREGSSGLRYTEDRLIGQILFQPGQAVLPPMAGAIGVIGREVELHLQGFEPTDSSNYLPAGHEITRILDNIVPDGLPDRWMGLDPFQTFIWADAMRQGSPTNLNAEQADAIREWVIRGGHLIVVLPPAGQEWIDYPSNLLSDMMPLVTLETEVGVDLSDFWPLFMTASHRAALEKDPLQAGQSPWWFGHQVHFLKPRPDAGFGEARPLLAGPDGRCVVAQRLHGRGAVTLIGIDITSGRFRSAVSTMPPAIESDVWWNRILGRRTELVAPHERGDFQRRTGFGGLRDDVWVDDGIQSQINQTGKAAAGLFLAFVVFAAYWVLAGPVAYLALKQQRMKQHSWVAFMAVGAVFTGVAWGGANLLRPRKIEGKHITILEHVYGQPVQAARSWVSVLLPAYGETRVRVENTEVAGVDITNAIAPWKPAPEMGVSSGSSFPDARGYVVDALSPNEMSVPTRATVKQFQIDWAGFLTLSMPTPLTAEGDSPALGEEIVAKWKDQPGVGPDLTVSGALVHDLPGELSEVTVILVEGQTPAPMPGFLPVQAWAVRLTKPWAAGDALSLQTLFSPPEGTGGRGADERRAQKFLDGLRGTSRFQDDAAIALFPLLKPPEEASAGFIPGRSGNTVFRRQATHGWDVARWFTQPCIIVLGRLDGPLPIPLEVGSAGADVTRNRIDDGKTFIRWIYPLPPRPPSIGTAGEDEEAAP